MFIKKKGLSIVLSLTLGILLFFAPPAKLQAAGEAITVTNYSINHSGAIEPQESFILTVTLVNQSGSDLDGAKVVVDSTSSFFAADGTGLTKTIADWNNGVTVTASFSLRYDGGSRNTLSISVIDNLSNAQTVANNTYTIAVSQAESTNPTQEVDTSTYVPSIDIISDPYVYAAAGENLTLALKIKNTSSYTAQNIRVIPDLSGESPFALTGNSSQFSVASLNPGETQTITCYFAVAPSALEKVYTLKLNLIYSNAFGNRFGSGATPLSEAIYVSVKNTNTFPRITIGNIRVTNPDQAHPTVMKTVIRVSNAGSLTAKNVSITLQGLKDDGLGLYRDSNMTCIDSLAGKGWKDITFYLIPSGKVGQGNYALSAKIEYMDESGKAYTSECQFFVPVQSGGGGATVPKIILNSYSCNPGIVKAGEKFTLNLSFLNTNPDKTVKNIKIYLTVPDGGADSSGSVFTPVNSSNTLFVDEIKPKCLAVKTLEFYTIPDAKPKTYSLTANFEYQDDQGTEYKATEIIGVPVNQQVNLETSELQIPAEGFMGQPVPISLEFYNTGKASISNLMFKVEGNFAAENSSYYVGTFDVGASDYFEATITPTSPGAQSGAVVITFDDPTGEHLVIKKEIVFNAQEMIQPQMPEGMPPVEMAPPINWKKRLLIIAATLIVLIIAGIVAHKKGLLKKLWGLRKSLRVPKFRSKKGQNFDE
ncbi:hypothetical protein LPY66_02170 [Dehalobacter sp. DCM]|uniref:COG1361 S-layer family protein n=1 Tax=Dehalobacter sp. DCM TaxID=2907827 RepID=UPI003082022F|nr:hypothetical protein LPY66_02170 [Dehalobacter sp. DCM]